MTDSEGKLKLNPELCDETRSNFWSLKYANGRQVRTPVSIRREGQGMIGGMAYRLEAWLAPAVGENEPDERDWP